MNKHGLIYFKIILCIVFIFLNNAIFLQPKNIYDIIHLLILIDVYMWNSENNFQKVNIDIGTMTDTDWLNNKTLHEFEEIIEPERIVQEKIEKNKTDALDIVKDIDNKISGHTIDLAHDNKNNKFYFIWNNETSLNIPLSIKQVNELWEIIIKLFNTDIQLFGSLFNRAIAEDSWVPDWAEEKFINNKISSLSKNDIEELFVFVMETKKIPKDDWEIASQVCANWSITDECKQALWNKKS